MYRCEWVCGCVHGFENMRIRVNEIVLVCVCLHVFKPACLSLCMLLDRSAYVCYICQCIYACCLVCVCVCVYVGLRV